jgi:hypothetical protein
MESLFIAKTSQSYLEIIIYIMMFLALAIIRNTNPNYSDFLVKNLLLKTDSFYKSLSSVNLQNKSTIFLNVNFLLSISILITLIYGNSFGLVLLSLSIFKLTQMLFVFLFEKTFLNKNNVISFTKRRIALTELTGVVTLIFLFLTHYLSIDSYLFITLSFLVMTIIWSKLAIVLSHYLSVFHIILYLCTLEILPILFLAKFIYKHLA